MVHGLLLVSVIIFLCIVLNKVSSKLGVPMLLAFILLGMFFGSDGVVKIPFDNYGFAQEICSVALIFIMFYGGFGTNTNAAKPVLAKSLLLSYATPAAVGGNGYLSTYIVGIILGNTKRVNHKTLVPFFDGLTGLMQMLIFFLLGLLSFPSRLPDIMVPALCIALFLTFVARPAVVFLLYICHLSG